MTGQEGLSDLEQAMHLTTDKQDKGVHMCMQGSPTPRLVSISPRSVALEVLRTEFGVEEFVRIEKSMCPHHLYQQELDRFSQGESLGGQGGEHESRLEN